MENPPDVSTNIIGGDLIYVDDPGDPRSVQNFQGDFMIPTNERIFATIFRLKLESWTSILSEDKQKHWGIQDNSSCSRYGKSE